MDMKIDFLVSYDKEGLAEELRRIAALLGKPSVTKSEIDRYGRVSSCTIAKRFGNLHRAREFAGLHPGIFRGSTDEELLKIVIDLWAITAKEHGRSPVQTDVRKYGFAVSSSTIATRFGNWRKALMAAAKSASLPLVITRADAEKGLPDVQTPKRARIPIPIRRRFLVFKRDQYTCCICRRKGGELHLDHKIPWSLGGSDNIDNLQTLCAKCNRGKGGNVE